MAKRGRGRDLSVERGVRSTARGALGQWQAALGGVGTPTQTYLRTGGP